jgi:hypothetical protein
MLDGASALSYTGQFFTTATARCVSFTSAFSEALKLKASLSR